MQSALDLDALLQAADRLPADDQAHFIAQEQLLAFGLEAEVLPELLEETLEAIGGARLKALAPLARAMVEEDLGRLEAGAGCPLDQLSLPPLLAADPEAAGLAQRQLLAALETRERLHRLGFLSAGLGLSLTVPAEIDERLRERVAAATALGPARAARAAQLDEDALASRWWWTLQPNEEAEATGEPQPLELSPLLKWLSERAVAGDEGAVLKLDRAEARALLATPRGRFLAQELEHRLDLSAAESDAAEREELLGEKTLGELLEESAGRVAPRARHLGLVVPLTARASSPLQQARQAAATGFELSHRNLSAVVQLEVHGAAVIDGLGVVARGRRQGTELAAWLVIPAVGVESVALVQGAPALPADWRCGGLLFCGADGTAPLELLVRTADDERGFTLIPAALQQDDPLLDALANLAAGLPEDARLSLQKARALLAESEAHALSGLEKALEEWRPEE